MCSAFRFRFVLPAAALCLSGLLLANPRAAAVGFEQGVAICLQTLLPALFPFFVTCSLVIASCSHRGSFWAALLLSWLGGYAVCAGLVHDLHVQGKISSRGAQLLLLLGCCSGPGFVVGSIGGQMLESAYLGLLLYVAQLVANLLAVLALWPFLVKRSNVPPAAGTPSSSARRPVSLSSAIVQAVNNCLSVCGAVVFFRILQAVWVQTFSFLSGLSPFVSAVLEISAGCTDFARLGNSLTLPGICLCMSVLGFSVFTQLHAILQGAADLRLLFFSRLVHIPCLWLLVRAGICFLPMQVPAFSSLAPRVITTSRVSPDAAFVIFLFLCAVLYKIRKKIYNGAIRG